MFILHDSSSLGYDIRDFEVAKDFIDSNVGKHFLIYTDRRNIEIFSRSLKSGSVIFEGYSKGKFSKKRLEDLVKQYQLPSAHLLRFSDLYSKKSERLKLDSGLLKPSLFPYLSPPKSLVTSYRSFLKDLASDYEGFKVIYAIVSGVKSISDIGETPSRQKLEGLRQTYPFEEIAKVLSKLEKPLEKEKIVLIAISAQYGDPVKIEDVVRNVNQENNLKFPIQFLDFVDWSDKPEQQAAMFRAIHERANELDLPSVAFGNASTYQHLIIASTGGFSINAIAVDSYYKSPHKDGRIYWKELGDGALPGLRVFQQAVDSPRNWDSVTKQFNEHLLRKILSFTLKKRI